MSVVHDALQTRQTLSARLRRAPGLVLALLCSAALIAGCGGSRHQSTRSSAVGPRGVGESLRLDNCSDWNKATSAERANTVAELRKFAGGPIGSSQGIQNGPVLDDARAFRLFENYCSHFFARGFKLYKLYTHAAAMVGSPP